MSTTHLAAVFSLLLIGPALAAEAPPPNFVFILADDKY